MAETLSPVPKLSFLDNNGKPAVGYKLFTYAAGTSIKLDTYVSSGGAANANPIILDYRGEANVWIPPNVAYKYVLALPDDTDPPSAPIWTVDGISNNQLLTLYGGVDSGSANNYVLNFDSPYSSYEDGEVIYWIPSNTNTGASTLNVNGLGPVAIVYPIVDPLVAEQIAAGQIVAGQLATVAYLAGYFILLSFNNVYISGQFTGTLTGCTTTPTATFDYVRNGNLISLYCNTGLTGTSNSTAMTITGLPSSLQPTFNRNVVCPITDNGTAQIGWVGVGGSGTMTFVKPGSNFTNSGTKGIGGNWTIIYSL